MISRDHSEIFIENDKYYIQDNSLNGTYVNDFRAPKKPDKQLLKEGDVIKFGHVNGAAIKSGEYAPQLSAEFIFKFEKAIPNHNYFGYSEKGVRLHGGNTRAYMQICSNRVAPQDSLAPFGTANISLLSNSSNNSTLSNPGTTLSSASNFSNSATNSVLQNNFSQPSTSSNVGLNLAISSQSTPSTSQQINSAVASSIVNNQHQQQQLSNVLAAQQQQNQLNVQQQQLAAAFAAAANITASTQLTEDVAAQLRQLMSAVNQDQSSSTTFPWLSPLTAKLQPPNQLYGLPAGLAAAAAFLNSNNPAVAMLWPNVAQQYRNALQPNTSEWVQQQKFALSSYSTGTTTASSIQQSIRLPQYTQTQTNQQNLTQQSQQQLVQQQNLNTLNNAANLCNQFVFSGNNARNLAPNCLPSTSAKESISNSVKNIKNSPSYVSQQFLSMQLSAAINNQNSSTVLMPNNLNSSNVNNMTLHNQKLLLNNGKTSSTVATTSFNSSQNPNLLSTNLSTASSSSLNKLASNNNAYSSCTSADLLNRAFSIQQDLSVAMAAAAAAAQQQQFKKEEELNVFSKPTMSTWPFTIASTSNTILPSSSNVSNAATGLPPNLASVLPAALRQGVSLNYSLPNSRNSIATALAAAAAASNNQQLHSTLSSSSDSLSSNLINNINNNFFKNVEDKKIDSATMNFEKSLISSINNEQDNTKEKQKLQNFSVMPSTNSLISASNVEPALTKIHKNLKNINNFVKCTEIVNTLNTPNSCITSSNVPLYVPTNKIYNVNSNLKNFDFKTSFYNSISNAESLFTNANSINSLNSKYFEQQKSLVQNLTLNSTLNELINKDLKTESEQTDNFTLKEMNEETKLNSAESTFIDSKQDNETFSYPLEKNNLKSVKTMECDSSVPSPPKFPTIPTKQTQSNTANNESLNNFEVIKLDSAINSPSLSVSSRPCSYQSIPQSPPRAPCPRINDSLSESDADSESVTHFSSLESPTLNIKEKLQNLKIKKAKKNFKTKRETEKKIEEKTNLVEIDATSDDEYQKEKVIRKLTNVTKRNEVERLLNDLTAGNCSWMYQARRNLNSSNKRCEFGNLVFQNRQRSLCFEQQKNKERKKKKLHKLLRQISNDTSDEDLCEIKSKEKKNSSVLMTKQKIKNKKKTESSDESEASVVKNNNQRHKLKTQKIKSSTNFKKSSYKIEQKNLKIKSKNQRIAANILQTISNDDDNQTYSKKQKKLKLKKEHFLEKKKNNENERRDKYYKNLKRRSKSSTRKNEKQKTKKNNTSEASDDNDDLYLDSQSTSTTDQTIVCKKLLKPPAAKRLHMSKSFKTKEMFSLTKNLKNKKKSFKDKKIISKGKVKLCESNDEEWNYHDPEENLCAYSLCKKPQDENVNWAACDACDKWFHTLCVFGSNVELNENADFNCGCQH